jgi:bifunctional non-homologous end joining protein LigD
VPPSRVDRPRHPDRIIFDLDPSTDDFSLVRHAARAVRRILEEVGLVPYVLTTGSRGLHVVAPLDRRADFEQTRSFAARVGELAVAREPSRFTIEQRKNKRRGRLFIDYLRNAYGQHGVAPYSVRPKPGAPVATPLDWDELSDRKMHARRYEISNLFRRLARKEDPWRNIERDAASLEKAMRRLNDQARED